MTQKKPFAASQKRKTLLALSILLGMGTGTSAWSGQPAYAVSSEQSAAVYKQFRIYVQQSSTPAKARSYLMNHIDEAGVWHATLMTLQLENAQIAQLPKIADKLYPEAVQKALDAAYRSKDLSYTSLLNTIKDAKIRAVLIEARDAGYKIRTSEGMYYPVMNYESYKGFKPYIKQDIRDYIDIMAAESNKPSTSDAAIIISWKELLNRALVMEDFVSKHQVSNRLETVKLKLWGAKVNVLFGSSNTSAYDFIEYGGPVVIDPKLRQAYEEALAKGSGDSELLQKIEKLLKLLDRNKNEFTPEVQTFINRYLDQN